MSDPIVAAEPLRRFTIQVLRAVGATGSGAECVAQSLVDANLAGHDSHGVMKLPSYVRDIRRGTLVPDAEPTVVLDAPCTARVDGAAGFGHVAASFATDLLIDKTRHTGVAMVALSHAHHTGRLGRWSERIAGAGLVGMVMGGEAQPPYKLAPHLGRSGALATNPVTWAVPRGKGRPPIVLDYATSAVSIGKLQVAAARGDDVPAGWFIDAAGRPSRDVRDFFDGGHLLPFGGHKGYALAVIVELLAVGLSAGTTAPAGHRSSCLFLTAVAPENFLPAEDFHRFATDTADRLTAVAPSGPDTEVLVPGDPELRSRRAREHGIPIPGRTWQALAELGDEVDVALPVLATASAVPEGA